MAGESDEELFATLVDAIACIAGEAPFTPEKLSREKVEMLTEWAGDLSHAASYLGARLAGDDREFRLERLRTAA